MTKEKEQALNDSKYIIQNFKDCLEKLEDHHYEQGSSKRDFGTIQALSKLTNKENLIPDDYSFDTEETYFNLLKSKEAGKVVTNIAEYLLETEGVKGE